MKRMRKLIDYKIKRNSLTSTLNVWKDLKFSNHEKNVTGVKNKYGTLKACISRATTVLWFAESFGLKIESIITKEGKSAIKFSTTTVNYHNPNPMLYGINSLSNEENKFQTGCLYVISTTF